MFDQQLRVNIGQTLVRKKKIIGQSPNESQYTLNYGKE